MKHIAILLLLVLVTISSCFATGGAWETGKMPYKPSTSGTVCWTAMRIYNEEHKREAIFHSINLRTGKINTTLLNDWYLIDADLTANGTLIARQADGTLQIAEYSDEGEWIPFLEYEFENAYTHWDASTTMEYERPVIAYKGDCLYFMMMDSEHEWMRRDDMKGNIHDYSSGHRMSQISPAGNICGYDQNEMKVVETVSDGSFVIGRYDEKRRSYFPIVWLDDERLLLWVRELETEGWPEFLYEYAFREDSFTPVYNENGEHISGVEGSSGFTASYDSETGRIVQLIFWAEDYFCVPTVLNLSDGKPVFIAETEHTDEYDEYCTTSDRVIWLKAR